jgi:xanthine/uracil permease
VGSIYSIAEVVGKEGLSRRVSRGIGITGLGGILAGGLGVFGTVSYGFSPGVVLVTRVGSRHPLVLCGALIVVLVFFQKLLALFSMVPPPVVGAALMAGMASQMGAGISVLAHRPLEGRDYLVVGIPILTGGVVSILPEGFFNQFPESIQALLRNGLVVGIVLVLILEHLLLPKGGSKGSHPPRG